MDRITGVMMSLLTGQVCGGEPPLPALTADEAAHLYALSKTYDLAHLTGSALLHRGLLPDGPLRAACHRTDGHRASGRGGHFWQEPAPSA